MITHILDTNAMIEIFNRPRGPVANRLRSYLPGSVAISSIAVYELYYGAHGSSRVAENLKRVDLIEMEVLPFEFEDARAAGLIRHRLETAGRIIGPYDILIAGQALARRAILVTANQREFLRVDGLTVEDWS